MSGPFFEAAVVVFREGLEAALMLAALAAFLCRSSAPASGWYLYAGAVAGGFATVAFAWGLQAISAWASTPYFEAALVLGSALLMTYLSGWMWAQRGASGWQRFMQRRASEAAEQSMGLAIAVLAALVVLREGAEVVIFLRVIARASGGWSVALVGGILAGLIVLAIAFSSLRVFSGRISMRALFLLTSGCLFGLSIKFIGEAVEILQTAGIISRSEVTSAAVLEKVGLNASWEAIILQAMVVALALTGMIALMRHKPVADP